MNSTTITSNYLKNYYLDISIRLSFVVLGAGVVLNALCIFVFIHVIRVHAKTRSLKSIEFLLYKSVIDFIYCSIRLFYQSTECQSNCLFFKFYSLQLIRHILVDYVGFILPLCSILFEIFANLDRLLSITNRNSQCSKILEPRVIMIATSSFSLVFYSYKFFETNIVVVEDVTANVTNYVLRTSTLAYFGYFGFTHSFIRDFLCVVVVFIVNILLLYNFKLLLNRRKKLRRSIGGFERVRTGSSIAIEHVTNKKENNLTTMMIVIGFLCILGHLPIFIRYVPISVIQKFINENDWFLKFVQDSFFFSLAISFFVYLFFDVYFKRTFFTILKRLFSY